MEMMRKILSSPLTRRRGQSSTSGSSATTVSNGTASTVEMTRVSNEMPRYFGVELSELVSRDGTHVPRLLLKLARSICCRGYGSVLHLRVVFLPTMQ